jgi:fatty acid desaturase
MSGETIERNAPGASAAGSRQVAIKNVAIEWPTLLLILAVFSGWLAVTYYYTLLPTWIVVVAGVLLVTLHGSLQHEMVHGHPTRWQDVNRALGMVPLSLWLPFERYRQTHRIHHNDERLTDPLDDPESFYWTPEEWARVGPFSRLFLRVEQTLAGRVIIGCFWRIARFLRAEFLGVVRNERDLQAIWMEHLLWCVPVVLWLHVICGMPIWFYVVALVIPANGIQLIRSFAEHRARPSARERIAVVEGSWILGPLFLFNNLHSLHHESPGIPWYQYHRHYRQVRERLLRENGGLVYDTYFDVARRFLFRPHDGHMHPTGRVPVLTGL